ncbi:PQQ-binding-like beta-propeller repeat protein, partial [bacterium]|nr:PQQ-binding-like beta-propeller repeat protein [bacterium]
LDYAKQWSRFRGPGGNGVSPFANAPTAWDGKSGDGILWKTPVPLSAPNSPVRWGDQLFMSGAKQDKLVVRCELYGFDAVSGKLQWTRSIEWRAKNEDDMLEPMEATGFAASTVATDGERVYAIFATGQILACTLDGKEAWVHNFGKLDNSYGHGSSLATDGKRLIVLLDQAMPEDKKSRLYAFDGPTGKIVWETVREQPHTWGTPIVIAAGKRREIICTGDPWLMSYDAKDGKALWRVDIMGGEIAPSPVFAGGHVIIANSGAYAAAIRPGGSGDVTKTHVAWKTDEGLPDISSPSATDELVFLLTSDGLLTCLDMKNGKIIWEHEFETAFSASPCLAGGKLYLTSEKGVTIVVQAGRAFKELGRSELGEKARASLAFGDGRIYLRGKTNLYGIGKK